MILHIKPQTKERHRYNSRTGTMYTPKQTREYEDALKTLYFSESGSFYTGRIKVWIEFGFYTKSRNRLLKHKTSKPDIDNLVKALFDGLRGCAWQDDASIVDVHARKVWAAEDYIELEIEEVDE